MKPTPIKNGKWRLGPYMIHRVSEMGRKTGPVYIAKLNGVEVKRKTYFDDLLRALNGQETVTALPAVNSQSKPSTTITERITS